VKTFTKSTKHCLLPAIKMYLCNQHTFRVVNLRLLNCINFNLIKCITKQRVTVVSYLQVNLTLNEIITVITVLQVSTRSKQSEVGEAQKQLYTKLK
jgi:hypothetical protein